MRKSSQRARISDEKIAEMLRRRRLGESISAIAKATGCHRQTVTSYLREREGDILADEARRQVLIQGLQAHFQQLQVFARQDLVRMLNASAEERAPLPAPRAFIPGQISLRGVLGLPALGPSASMAAEWRRMYEWSPAAQHLLEGLREHLPGSGIWIYWDQWQKETANYQTASRGLLAWITVEIESNQNIDLSYLESVQDWVWGNILRQISGGKSENLQVQGQELILSSGREIVKARDGKSQALSGFLRGLLREAEHRAEWKALDAATRQLNAKQKEFRIIIQNINMALIAIELMQGFPGRCHLCPV